MQLSEEGESLDFLIFTFRYYDDLKRTFVAVLECVPAGEGAETRAGQVARNG